MRFHQASTHFSNPTLALKVLSTLASLTVMLAFSAAASAAATGNFDGPAELPRVYVQTDLAHTPAPGTVISVPSGGNFQEALNNANCGDTIKLQAGATFAGTFVVPARPCDDSHWIIVRTSAPDSSLPPEGTRISPCYAGPPSIAPPPRMSWRRFKFCVQEAVGPC
jgi:hypothetical protein